MTLSEEKNEARIPFPGRTVVGPPRPLPRPPLFLSSLPERIVETKREAPVEPTARIRPEKGISIVSGEADGNRVFHDGEQSFQAGDSNATGNGRAGGGIGFDFYSPPDFNEEMAKAREKVRIAEGNHRLEKITNPGHGVICNTAGSWFVCKQKTIDACNAAHDNLCRYAKKAEREALRRTVLF